MKLSTDLSSFLPIQDMTRSNRPAHSTTTSGFSFAKAERAETSVTGLVRSAALGKSITVRKSKGGDFATRDELRRIGVNLNQIARAMNARKHTHPEMLAQVCEKLDRLFDQWLDHGSSDREDRP